MAQAQREWFEKDYYKVLGVPEGATADDIRRAYRKLAKRHHPDAGANGSGESGEKFKEISAAYDVLSDTDRRRQYDEVRRLGPAAGSPGGPGGWAGPGGPGGRGGGPAGGFAFNAENLGDLGDILGGFFGRGRGGPAGPAGPGGAAGRATPRTPTSSQRGADLEAELHLAFVEAVGGVTTTLTVTSDAPCSSCRGTGAAPGTAPVTCPQCGGRGVLDDNQGFFALSQTCRRCQGAGSVVEKPCPACSGRGAEARPRQVKVRIPAGVDEGQRIRLKGQGGPGRNGGPPGDLFVVVRVERHPVFARTGTNLTVTVPVTFAEAALGGDITVPTLDGPVVLKVPPGTRSGKTFRVKGRGIAAEKATGDLLVTVEVAVPTKLSEAERDAIEALAQVSTQSPRAHLGV